MSTHIRSTSIASSRARANPGSDVRTLCESDQNAIELMSRKSSVPVIVVCPDMTVVDANPMAAAMLDEADVLAVRFDRLASAHTADDADLRAAIKNVVDSVSAATPHLVAFERRATGFKVPVVITAIEVQDDHGEPMTVASLRIVDTEHEYSIEASHLRQVYDLSPAESRLACALMQGHSLADYADTRCVTLNTARTQLKAVFRKTGFNTQARLVRALMGIATGISICAA